MRKMPAICFWVDLKQDHFGDVLCPWGSQGHVELQMSGLKCFQCSRLARLELQTDDQLSMSQMSGTASFECHMGSVARQVNQYSLGAYGGIRNNINSSSVIHLTTSKQKAPHRHITLSSNLVDCARICSFFKWLYFCHVFRQGFFDHMKNIVVAAVNRISGSHSSNSRNSR